MSRYKTAKEYRNELTPEDIKNILRKFGVEPVTEKADYIIYPTVNHNLEGGSPKLYYYKKNKMFKVYTGEAGVFDIFQLVIDMHNLRGKPISLREAIEFCGFETSGPISDIGYYNVRQQLEYLESLKEMQEHMKKTKKLLTYDYSVLSRFIFSEKFLQPWIQEGISLNTLQKYEIKFDTIENAIIIPYFSDSGELVGVRGRFLSPDAHAKYMPIKYNGKYLVHPTAQILYGLNINKERIAQERTAIIFEGEKSVMKMDTIYKEKNIALALSGRSFSNDHIDLLLSLGVSNLIFAFDRDYTSVKELEEEIKKLDNALRYAKNFFTISLVVDPELELGYKDSPIDCGKELFEKLMENRVFI